jgi:hypothetical protein
MKNTAERMDLRQESAETTEFLNQAPGVSLEKNLARLVRLSENLHTLGVRNSLWAMVTLVGMLLSIFIMMNKKFSSVFNMDEVRFLIGAMGMAAACYGLLLLFIWERRCQEGMVLYEEISDEVEWRHRDEKRMSDEDSQKSGRPNLTIRITLREFLRTTSLPLVPRPFSALGYFTFHLICLVVQMLWIL